MNRDQRTHSQFSVCFHRVMQNCLFSLQLKWFEFTALVGSQIGHRNVFQ